MKSLFIILIFINLGFAKNITLSDISWTLNKKDKCENLSQTKFKKHIVKMLNGHGYTLNFFHKKYQMREYTKRKSVFWMFPNKAYCEKFKKHMEEFPE